MDGADCGNDDVENKDFVVDHDGTHDEDDGCGGVDCEDYVVYVLSSDDFFLLQVLDILRRIRGHYTHLFFHFLLRSAVGYCLLSKRLYFLVLFLTLDFLFEEDV